MPLVSDFQKQYPLSPRKFWKKMYDSVLPSAVFGTFFGFFFGFISLFLGINPVSISDSFGLIWLVWSLVFFIILMTYFAVYLKIYIRRYYYDATENYITIKKGVFGPAEIHAQYAKVQDVYVDQDIMDRILGIYDVHLATATLASGRKAHIDGVDRATAEGLKDFLLQKIQTGNAEYQSKTDIAKAVSPVSSNETVKFEKEISSDTYPINRAWFLVQTVAGLGMFAVIAVILFLFPSGPKVAALSGQFSSIFLMVVFGLYVISRIADVLWVSTYSFNFLPDYIVIKQGIIAKSETHVPYHVIQDVTVMQGVVERLFGLATVKIQNAAEVRISAGAIMNPIEIPGQPLEKANEISEAIRRIILTKSVSKTGL